VDKLLFPHVATERGLLKAFPLDTSTMFSYGLGWDVYSYMSHTVVEKGGALPGMRSVCVLIPEYKLGITILANLGLTQCVEAIKARFLELVLGTDNGDTQLQIAESQLQLAGLLTPPRPLSHFNATECARYEGTYFSPLYGTFIVCNGKLGQLKVFAGQTSFEGALVAIDNHTFELSWKDNPMGYHIVTFHIDDRNSVYKFSSPSLGTFRKLYYK